MAALDRLLIGNLDCEIEYGSGKPLPKTVATRIAAAATTLRVFGNQGDALWVSATIDPNRLPFLAPLPSIAIVGGAPPPAQHILAWGETSTTHSLRRSRPTPPIQTTSWQQRLWDCTTHPAIAKACNHRGFSHDLARDLGISLPGERILYSIDQLIDHLATFPPDQGWVLKAPWSAAGRDRIRRRGCDIDLPTHTRLARLFQTHSSLVWEPWAQRKSDFGCCGIVYNNSDWKIFPPHQLLNHPAGVFRGIIVHTDTKTWLSDSDHEQIKNTSLFVVKKLATRGYRGPFSIDGYIYQDQGGNRKLRSLCELNARMSFGLVARAYFERIFPHCTSMEFHLGNADPKDQQGITPLLLPTPSDPTAAWLIPHGA